jgi:hypothetical protein
MSLQDDVLDGQMVSTFDMLCDEGLDAQAAENAVIQQYGVEVSRFRSVLRRSMKGLIVYNELH